MKYFSLSCIKSLKDVDIDNILMSNKFVNTLLVKWLIIMLQKQAHM